MDERLNDPLYDLTSEEPIHWNEPISKLGKKRTRKPEQQPLPF
jgi:hypothetical protein